MELNIWSLRVLAKKTKFSLELFVWRSFWCCLCVVLSVWNISLLLIQPSLLILLYFCLALLLLSENSAYEENLRFIFVVSRDMMWKLKKRDFWKTWSNFKHDQMLSNPRWHFGDERAFFYELMCLKPFTKYLNSAGDLGLSLVSSSFLECGFWSCLGLIIIDHIARTPRFSHNPWSFFQFISTPNLEMRPILILVVSLYERCDDLAIKLL